jgi:hypothetical protein
VSEPEAISTHELPVWRDRANYILQADLGEHGLPGRFEQLWAGDLGHGLFELCCLPFFTYGYALGDIVRLESSAGPFQAVLGRVVTRSNRALLRVAFTGPVNRHEELHASLAASGRPHEWRGAQLVAIDVEGAVPDALWQTVQQFSSTGDVHWEWGREPTV